ncbi:LytTR family DNA-binding domain-containing protein [Muricauda sp. SCSIO 64092]|uniref:LytR/AlgR family response regulator transcription factor n=1 Tax=Allomuricauda sp. SCSIO 64092 TaxID=2908842 RepID=UPI001FF2AE7A|nr:LytTR family DNA-binding domain-containing protein [Muricauda sp. SCSIO 64092]UOY08275.1 LytTR family DNA-binding domain-containing protein [Muricauda sp. SCSIO 64092]
MINCIVIEDEDIAAQRLVGQLVAIDSNIVVDAIISTKKDAIAYLSNHTPDLIFMDINLTDGISFEIFDFVHRSIPIIFTTAYSEYALKAFEQYSIDYLLKPINPEQLIRSVNKYKTIAQNLDNRYDQLVKLLKREYKSRFLIKWNKRLLSIDVDSIAYFFSEDKLTFLCHWDGNKYPVGNSLKNLEMVLNPKLFFRINKKYLIRSSAIKEMYYTSKSKMRVVLQPNKENEMIFVAIEKLGKFKSWLSK